MDIVPFNAVDARAARRPRRRHQSKPSRQKQSKAGRRGGQYNRTEPIEDLEFDPRDDKPQDLASNEPKPPGAMAPSYITLAQRVAWTCGTEERDHSHRFRQNLGQKYIPGWRRTVRDPFLIRWTLQQDVQDYCVDFDEASALIGKEFRVRGNYGYSIVIDVSVSTDIHNEGVQERFLIAYTRVRAWVEAGPEKMSLAQFMRDKMRGTVLGFYNDVKSDSSICSHHDYSVSCLGEVSRCFINDQPQPSNEDVTKPWGGGPTPWWGVETKVSDDGTYELVQEHAKQSRPFEPRDGPFVVTFSRYHTREHTFLQHCKTFSEAEEVLDEEVTIRSVTYGENDRCCGQYMIISHPAPDNQKSSKAARARFFRIYLDIREWAFCRGEEKFDKDRTLTVFLRGKWDKNFSTAHSKSQDVLPASPNNTLDASNHEGSGKGREDDGGASEALRGYVLEPLTANSCQERLVIPLPDDFSQSDFESLVKCLPETKAIVNSNVVLQGSQDNQRKYIVVAVVPDSGRNTKENQMRFLQTFLDIFEWATAGPLYYGMTLPGFLRQKLDQRLSAIQSTFQLKTTDFPPRFYTPPSSDAPFSARGDPLIHDEPSQALKNEIRALTEQNKDLTSRITKLGQNQQSEPQVSTAANTHTDFRPPTHHYPGAPSRSHCVTPDDDYMCPRGPYNPFPKFNPNSYFNGTADILNDPRAERTRQFWAEYGPPGSDKSILFEIVCLGCKYVREECHCDPSDYDNPPGSQWADLTHERTISDLRVPFDDAEDKVSEVSSKIASSADWDRCSTTTDKPNASVCDSSPTNDDTTTSGWETMFVKSPAKQYDEQDADQEHAEAVSVLCNGWRNR
ncbi:hypothetical protein F5Y18DRAFT_422174 [Xylariaceae sp. FL1019]|nr:hypothetical protein F5Y18DRAFT_422174 [Xylariaceae sp. FL1019]